jgi:hypothetical protein
MATSKEMRLITQTEYHTMNIAVYISQKFSVLFPKVENAPKRNSMGRDEHLGRLGRYL